VGGVRGGKLKRKSQPGGETTNEAGEWEQEEESMRRWDSWIGAKSRRYEKEGKGAPSIIPHTS